MRGQELGMHVCKSYGLASGTLQISFLARQHFRTPPLSRYYPVQANAWEASNVHRVVPADSVPEVSFSVNLDFLTVKGSLINKVGEICIQ